MMKNRISFSVDSLLATTEQNHQRNRDKHKKEDQNENGNSTDLSIIKKQTEFLNQITRNNVLERLQIQLKNGTIFDANQNDKTSIQKENIHNANTEESSSDNDNYQSTINLSDRFRTENDSRTRNASESSVGSDVDVEDVDEDCSNVSDRTERSSPEKIPEKGQGLIAPQPLRAPVPRFFQNGPPVSWPFPAFSWMPNNPLFRGSPNCTYIFNF